MSKLESKLLDGKAAGYCSSSDEDNDSGWQVAKDDDQHQANVMRQMGTSGNTGPKGVLNDFRDFKEQQKYERATRDRAILKQARKGMLLNTAEERDKEDESDEEDSLESLRAKRLQEMRKAARGRIVELIDKNQFMQATDTCIDTLMCVLLYEPENEACDRMSHVCKILASDYPLVKFARSRSSILGMSKNFMEQGVPCLQFYSHGNLIKSFMAPDFGTYDFTPAIIKQFLRRQHISLDRGRYTTDSEYSTDDDVD